MSEAENVREGPAPPLAPLEYLDKHELRAAVSLAGVASVLGILVDDQGFAACPFHADEHPSFHVFEDPSGVERWACYPCGLRGDVYDLVQRVEGLSFPDAMTRVQRLRGVVPPAPKREPRRAFDRDACAKLVAAGRARAGQPEAGGWLGVFAGLVEASDPLDYRLALDAHLRDHWRWGVGADGELVFPHHDATGVLNGAKFRALDGVKWSFPGSHFFALYGSWRQREHRTVVLCEGETDCAWAAMSRPRADVLGLPNGAGRWEDAWTALEADVYWLAFDADEEGFKATVRWQQALEGRDVRVINLQPGEDLKASRLNVAQIVG